MKKLLLVAAVAALTVTSCKKDYTCACTTTLAGITETTNVTFKNTKSKAKTSCSDLQTADQSAVQGTGATVSCAIK